MSEKIVLVDGYSIINRAYYGVPNMTNSQGIPTNAVYGFFNILFKIMDDEQPQYLAVAFDMKGKTFRHERYSDYKGTRKPAQEEMIVQVPYIQSILKGMQIPMLALSGYEADDLLGTIACKAQEEGVLVTIVTGDRDLLQIATDKIKIRMPKTKGGKTEVIDYYAKDVEREWGLTPTQFIELKALMGDTSDNIPGVPKVGEVTAKALMAQYGSLEEIFNHIEEVSKPSIRESLRENQELAWLSKELATICTEAPIEYDLQAARVGELFTQEAYEVIRSLELKSYYSRFEVQRPVVMSEQNLVLISGLKAWETLLGDLAGDAALSIQEGSQAFYVAIAAKKQCYVLQVEKGDAKRYFDPLMKKTGVEWIVFGAKELYDKLPYSETLFDCKIAYYLLDPMKKEYPMEDLAGAMLGEQIPQFQEVFGKVDIDTAYTQEASVVQSFLARQAEVLLRAKNVLAGRLHDTQMWNLFQDIEMPLTWVLYGMQQEGIPVNRDILQETSETLGEQLAVLEQKIYELAETTFNIQSPKQLGDILFDRLQLPGGKKTKSGYSTAADVLDKLVDQHPIVGLILEYRTVSKLKSTYADALQDYIMQDGRIHTVFHQTVAATGRISSSEPNLQNIPIRSKAGRELRKVFAAKEGFTFVDADYSQIELRILAHMSGDENLISAYQSKKDIHRITASEVFHIPFDEVTDVVRRNAKAVNFGIVYGISSFGLSQDLSISRKEAADYIDKYFVTYPGVKLFLDRLVEDAKQKGYAESLFSRRRPILELQSSNYMQRMFGERIAMNSPIQGTAADIMKVAMIRVFFRLQEENLESRLILQVHDELLIETKLEELERVKVIVKEEMEHAATLKVDMVVDIHDGPTWFDAK